MRTIAAKLTRIYLVVAISVIFTTGLISLLYLYHHTRSITHENLKTQAAALAGNLESAVAFGDTNFAQQTLNSLKHYPEVLLAVVRLPDGHLLAKYTTPNDTKDNNSLWPLLERSEFISGDKHGVTQAIAHEGEISAHLILIASLRNLNREALLIFVASMAIGSLLLLISYAMFWRMSRAITHPIEMLTAVMRTIERVGDHYQKTTIVSDDEIGELAIALDNMRHNIRQRTTELLINQEKLALVERQQAVIEATTRAKDLFLANMSHEIRTPMNAIIGLNDLALKQELPPKVRDYLIKIHSASHSLLRIINDILDFSKIESGQLILEQESFHLSDLFEHLSDLLRNQAAEKNIELIMAIAQDCPISLFGDALRLEQILLNLISNAIKFTEQGIVYVQARSIPREPATRNKSNGVLESNDDRPAQRVMLEFTVQDSGIGLSSEQINKLFHPFVQADDSTTRRYGGTGLGLSICKRLVGLMGGQIGVESNLGKGSIFHFTIVCEQRPDLRREIPLPPESLRGLKVLVADDNEVAREIFDSMLRKFTFAPTLVASGDEAVIALENAMANGSPYPLVCLDYRMPGMNGIETAQKILDITTRRTSISPLPKIILLSAFCREEFPVAQLNLAGISVFLRKPINCSYLFDSIMKLFGQQVAKLYRSREEQTDYTEISNRIGGARILLVEDTPINQQVAQELLAGVGILVDMANNGAEAVQMVQKGSYDAVLMDIQMPIMDGHEAVRVIRRDPRFAQLPIIAMTAHALTSDREKSLTAGMNDHIVKPIDPDRLFSLLITYIKPGDRASIDRKSLRQLSPSSHEETAALEKIPGFDLKSALHRVMGNQALLVKLLVDFKQDYDNSAKDVRKCLTQGEPERGRRIVHQIKGLTGNIGARTVHAAARTLELAIEQRHENDWPVLVDTFESTLEEFLVAITDIQSIIHKTDMGVTSNSGPDSVGTLDNETIKPALLELAAHLRKFSISAHSAFNAIKPFLLQAGFHQEVEQMTKQINRFRFNEALSSLEAISEKFGIFL
ncbi:two-component system, sensor histidine kinase and response regulator [Gammaproteobacteria bacterium]